MFVVDASVALAWCFADEASDIAEAALGRLEHEDAIAPSIWPFEVANGLRTAERRGRLDLSDLSRVRELLLSLPVEVDGGDLRLALGEVTEIARSLDLTANDASYIALASRRGLSLASADDRLRRAAASAGLALIG